MRGTTRGRAARLAVVAAASGALLLSACGGSSVNQAQPAPSGSSAPCGEFDLAMNAWVGYTASASVVSYVAENELGCTVNQKDLNEQVAWQGFESGEVDVIIENWAHADLKQTYIEEQKVAEIAGKNGNVGQIGWFVPPWLAEEHPDITSWENLNTYAELFRTGESGDKGQLLDGDPAFVTNDAALVKNLDLDYEVVYSGSEAALITAFRDAEKNRKPLLGYFYSPQWFLAEVPLVMVELPPWTEGCDADVEAVACGYPEDQLDKIISTSFATSGSPAVELVRNFSWTNEDQNEVALAIAEEKMEPEEAARQWVEAHPDQVNAWLGR